MTRSNKLRKEQSENNEGAYFVNPRKDNFINKGKLPIDCEDNVKLNNNKGNENSEIKLFGNPQTGDCVNNLCESIEYTNREQNVQPVDGLILCKKDNQKDLVDLSFLDDPDFLKDLNS